MTRQDEAKSRIRFRLSHLLWLIAICALVAFYHARLRHVERELQSLIDSQGIQRVKERLNTPVAICVINQPISNALKELSEAAGVEFQAEEDVSLQKSISIELDGISARSAFRLVLNRSGLAYSVTSNGIRVHRAKR